MKILQVIPFFAPAWGFGGPVRVCFDISKELTDNGHDIAVATTDAYDSRKRLNKPHETIEGIKIIRFQNFSPRFAKEFNLYLPFGFKRWSKNNIQNFDLVHLHTFFTYQNIIAAYYCRRFKIPYVLHLHESLIPMPLLGKVWFKKMFNKFFGKKILFGAARIFVISQKEKNELSNFLPEIKSKIELIPNCINLTFKKSPEVARTKYGVNEKDKIILTLSRLSFIKGIDLLIRAFAKLVEKDSNYRLLIAGPDEGGGLKKLTSLAKSLKLLDKVSFLGLIEGRKKEEIFATADIFALFSRYESFSLTTLEALQHDLPVCLSKEVGVAGEVLRFNCGVATNPYDAPKSAAKLEWVYNNKDVLAKNCQPSLSQFDIKKVADKVNKIYQEIVKG